MKDKKNAKPQTKVQVKDLKARKDAKGGAYTTTKTSSDLLTKSSTLTKY